jgi:hypothetical protein
MLGYVSEKNGAFLVKAGVAGNRWTVAQPSGVRSIALAEGSTASSALMGFVSNNGAFWAKQGAPNSRWTHEANHVTAISVAAVGPSATPLLAYLAAGRFYVGEGLEPATWTQEASDVAKMAVAAGAAAGASQILGYLTHAGELEVRQGGPEGRFSPQATGATSLAIASVINS